MSQSFCDLVVHIVFSTKERTASILPSVEDELYKYICGICVDIDCPVIKINGVEDHIHILLHLSKVHSIAQVISEIKSNSSRWIKSKGTKYSRFSWQSGYGAFSVSRPNIEGAIQYIANQKEHHKQVSFQDEFRNMLNRAKIKYEEKYLWD
jgi:putative transposase